MHDLVAAGVGGRTVKEAKERLTHQELMDWLSYVRDNGPLNPGVRTDRGFAKTIAAIHSVLSKHPVSVEKFLPKYGVEDQPEEGEGVITPELLGAMFGVKGHGNTIPGNTDD